MARARRACPDGVFLAPALRPLPRREPRGHGDPALVHAAGRADRARRGVPRRRRRRAASTAPGPRSRVAIRAPGARRDRAHRRRSASPTTKLLAKLASDLAKPDGLLVVEPGTELEFLHPLPVGGSGASGPRPNAGSPRSACATVGDLAALPEDTLVRAARQRARVTTSTRSRGTATSAPVEPTAR